MNLPTDTPQIPIRKSVYWLLIAIGVGMMLGRIFAVDSIDYERLQRARFALIPPELERRQKQFEAEGLSAERIEWELERIEAALEQRYGLMRPFLSANDRSRWCTLRALVERDMWVAEDYEVDGETRARWVPYSIDNVQAVRGWDTIDMVKHDGHLYSSKPPLFPTLAAIPYWVIHQTTGATLGTHPYEIGRTLLVLLNVVPLVVYFLLLVRLVERFGNSDWGRIFVVAVAVFGTFLTTFSIVLNNHLPGAVSAMIAIYAAIRIWFDGERRLRYFVLVGLFATFAVACELPALSLAASLTAALLWKAPRQTLVGLVPAALLVTAGFFATNWIAHQSLRPPYMHRDKTDAADNWYDYTYETNGRTVESYWNQRIGIDRGEPCRGMYALHMLIGHHGIFSLTPVWLLSVIGSGMWLFRREDPNLRQLALLIVTLAVVCIVFFISRGQDDRNYGGMTSGFRWVFWLAPMWLLAMLPAADWIGRRRSTRAVALVLLAFSALSVSYPTWNPWTHPWLMDWFYSLGK